MKRPINGFDASILEQYPTLKAFVAEVGDTELLEVETPADSGRIFAKCEWDNPGGSIKDRTAVAMLWDFLQRNQGQSLEGKTILEYSGGALAMSLARLCGDLGIRCVLVLMESTSPSVIETIRANGGEVVLRPKDEGFWGVMEHTFALSKANPDWDFFYQHNNPANPRMHCNATGEEILAQLPDGLVPDAWLAAVGTGGSLIGVYQRLSQENPDLKLYPVTPKELPYGSEMAPHGKPKFSGSGGLGCGRKQQFVAAYEAHVTRHYHFTLEEARAAMVAFRDQTGVQIGSSAAANLLAARDVAAQLGPDSTVVTIFPNAGFKEEWTAVEAAATSTP